MVNLKSIILISSLFAIVLAYPIQRDVPQGKRNVSLKNARAKGIEGNVNVAEPVADSAVSTSTQADSTATGCSLVAVIMTVTIPAGDATPTAKAVLTSPPAASPSATASTTSARASTSAPAPAPSGNGNNLQKFTGLLGGAAPAITAGGSGFQTDGNNFVDIGSAINRSCDTQHNTCANAANKGASFKVGDCDKQSDACKAAA